MSDFINISNLSFSYPSSSETLFDSVSFQLHKGWTGIVGSNGSGKSTLLKLICGLINSHSGSILFSGSSYYCEQPTENIPERFNGFLNSFEKSSFRLKEVLQIKDEWIHRWNTLSHGERKRCQIATALYVNPYILAIDEPSNHLDKESKEIIFTALKSFKGIGLLVSHDRQLLDELCHNTMFISNRGIDIRKCNYSTAHGEMERENSFKQNEYLAVKKEIKKLKNKAVDQKGKADKADKLRSKRNIDKNDHDAKAKIDAARLTGKDALEGRLYNRIKTKLDRKINYQQSIQFNRQYQLGIEFNSQKLRHYFPIHINTTKIKLGEEKILNTPDLMIQAGERIGITGSNGSGKSTFIKHLIKQIKFSNDELIYIPQEVSSESMQELMKVVHNLKDVEKGKILTIISRLNSDPKHLLETENPSPGEVRKLMLAIGITKNPALIIMDEPTNHMDLPSIECIENALQECACALLLVSHDMVFLQNIVTSYWNFEHRENRSEERRVGKECRSRWSPYH